MIYRIISLLGLILISASLPAQTPEQSYLEWTTLPFSKEELGSRRANLLRVLQEDEKSGIVLIPARNGTSHGDTFRQLDDFYYFTGLELPNSMLVIDLENETSTIYSPGRDARFESASRPNDFPGRPLATDQRISTAAGIDILNIDDLRTFLKIEARKRQTVLLNTGRSAATYPISQNYITSPSVAEMLVLSLEWNHAGFSYENIYNSIAKVRMIKSPAEIELLRKAVSITVEGIKTSARTIKPGIDERYLEGILEGSYKVNGSTRLAFGSIIKSGPNSLWPWRILATHYDRRNRKMEGGDLVIFDVGCEYQNYVSDVGRTFPVSGKFSDRQREILAMEMGISDQIIAFIKPGITFQDLRDLTDRIIPEDAKQYMQASLFFGHHLGLSTGDPNLQDAELKPGMIFTVEPWYYNHDEQISVFTEDVILVTENGCEVLSDGLPRTPEGLEKLMRSKK